MQGVDNEKTDVTVMVYGCLCGWRHDVVSKLKQRYRVTVKYSRDDKKHLAEHVNYLILLNDELCSYPAVVAFNDTGKVKYLAEFK